MLFRRFYDDKLAQASYLIGCQATGEAAVVDPNRDVEQYVAAAEEEGLRITHVTETHIHADFVSGARELAARTGAQLLLSDEGGPDWRYAYAAEANARLLHHGDRFMVGNIAFAVMHTPGHTPEHISFVVTDTPASDRPMGVLTGDFVFAGDVGRPDLLERAAHVAGTMEAGAQALFRSLQRFKQFPDYLQLWPGHGAGSACGKALGAVPTTTLGYERLVNWAFAIEREDDFVAAVLAGQPEPPRYFGEMKRINRDGPRLLGGVHLPPRLPEGRLADLLRGGAVVIDARPASEFATGHVPGTINVPLDRSFTTWAGWLVPYDRDFFLIGDEAHAHAVHEAARDLAMIGLDGLAGYFGTEAIQAWEAEGRALATVAQVSARELLEELRSGAVAVVDVRGYAEWEEGHLPGSINVPVGMIPDRLAELPRDRPLVVQCRSGGRSAIAASVLRAHGVSPVANLAGGILAWQAQGLPVTRSASGGALRDATGRELSASRA